MRPARAALAAAIAIAVSLMLLPVAADATYPGRVGRIAFGDFTTGRLFTVNPDGTRLRRLTHGGPESFADTPSWSPSGRRLIFSFSATPSAAARIWVTRADGTHQHPLAGDAKGFRDFDPTYGPDGRTIVFSRCQPGDGVCAIWRMRADGSGKRALTPYRSGTNEAVDISPSISPGGGRVAFTRFFSDGIKSRVFVMDANGGHPHPITPPGLEASFPDWSPSGRRIAFTSNALRLGSSIFTIHPDGRGLHRVTRNRYPHNGAAPAYSPSGHRLAFISDRAYPHQCCLDLFTISPAGTHEQLFDTGLDHRGFINPAWGSAPPIP
jgi:Tol biopolymer transport system component